MTDPTVVGQIPTEAETPSHAVAEGKPARALPTDRIAFPKQLDVLRAFAIASGTAGKAVTTSELASITKLNISTASYNNTFFVESGLIAKGPGGFTASAEVQSFNRAWAFDTEKAAHKLAPVLRRTWFGELTHRLLSMHGSIAEKDALTELADAAHAGTKYLNNLRVLLDYLQSTGLIERDGATIKMGPTARDRDGDEPRRDDLKTPEPQLKKDQKNGGVLTSFEHVPEGNMRIFVDMSVDLRELATWKPEVVAAFFGGVAQVLSAKAMVERERGR